MIVTENLTKIYELGDTKVVGNVDINLTIKDNEFTAIMGPSGSGKSTLLHMIGGLDRPTRGKVIIDGLNIAEMSDKTLCDMRRDKIGFIFQTFNLVPTLTTIENVIVPMAPRGLYGDVWERAMMVLESVGLGDRIEHTPSELSGGQRQRVAIARALVNNPGILLADEPTGNLDTKSGKEVLELMKNMNTNSGVTVIIVTHDPKVADLTDRTIYLEDGNVIRDEYNGNR
ncbi:MAG: ABC transporter ATP-binding protein [Halobacteriota archaeon]|nr:ABC transporter ATP-binding protein [Halobacteriota archaeon]